MRRYLSWFSVIDLNAGRGLLAALGRLCLLSFSLRRGARDAWGAAPNPAKGMLSLWNPDFGWHGAWLARRPWAALPKATSCGGGGGIGTLGALPQTLLKGCYPFGIPTLATPIIPTSVGRHTPHAPPWYPPAAQAYPPGLPASRSLCNPAPPPAHLPPPCA